MADTNADKILESSQGPKSASGDGQSAEAHPIPDQIAADRYASAKKATTGFPVRRVKFVPPPAD